MAKFQKGESGNPAGRPPGSASASLRLLRDAAEDILPMLIERAKSGDLAAQQFILDRALPRMRPVTPAEPLTMPDGNFVDQARALLRLIAEGEISPTTAAEVAGIIAQAAKVEEIDQLRDELAALRAVLEARKKSNGKRT